MTRTTLCAATPFHGSGKLKKFYTQQVWTPEEGLRNLRPTEHLPLRANNRLNKLDVMIQVKVKVAIKELKGW